MVIGTTKVEFRSKSRHKSTFCRRTGTWSSKPPSSSSRFWPQQAPGWGGQLALPRLPVLCCYLRPRNGCCTSSWIFAPTSTARMDGTPRYVLMCPSLLLFHIHSCYPGAVRSFGPTLLPQRADARVNVRSTLACVPHYASGRCARSRCAPHEEG